MRPKTNHNFFDSWIDWFAEAISDLVGFFRQPLPFLFFGSPLRYRMIGRILVQLIELFTIGPILVSLE